MGIGGSILLIAVGAIIAFALHVHIGWLDLQIVGWVLMAAGAIALVLLLMAANRRRTTVTTVPTDRQTVTRTSDTYELPDERL